MKKIITLLLVVLINTISFAQKHELKDALKSLEKNSYTEALNALNRAQPLISDAKDRYKTHYYFLLGKALYANGTTPKNFEKSAAAFNTLFELEKNTSLKYTNDAAGIVNAMVTKVVDGASADYNKAILLNNSPDTRERSVVLFKKAAKGFETVYAISSRDTAFIQNSALAYHFSNDFEKSNENYQKLLDLGYTGISTRYSATSTVNGQKIQFPSKSEMEKQIKLKLAADPVVDVRKAQRNGIVKMIAKNYIALKDNERALVAIKEAKKVTPNDYGLLVDEANVYFAMGNKAKFKEKLEEAVKLNPTDPMLHYNIGVMKMELKDNEAAIRSFNKAIELKPDYTDAYNNIGAAILTKAKPIVEKMNQNLNNFKKYDQLQAQQLEVYREALPFFEKVYEMDKTNRSVIQTLMGIYENLEMGTKAKELKAAYERLK